MSDEQVDPADVRGVLLDTSRRLAALAADEAAVRAVQEAGDLLVDRLGRGGLVLACGNGGSMSDAMHFAAELSVRYRQDRSPLRAVALSDVVAMSATGNDYGYERTFSRAVEALGSAGDVLVAISTSGRSPNVVAAATAMRERGGSVIALTGVPGSELGALADVDLTARGPGWADRAQEVHIVYLHLLVGLVEAGVGPVPSAG